MLHGTMDSPPPYTPHDTKLNISPTAPSAPSAPELYPDLYYENQPAQHSPVFIQQQPREPVSFPAQSLVPQLQIVDSQLPAVGQSNAIAPLRVKGGYVEVGINPTNDVEKIQSWTRQYVEVKDGLLRVAATKTDLQRSARIPLAGRYVSIENKRLVAIQGNDGLYVLKPTTEVRAYQWLMTLSQYCVAAPALEGYCWKYSRGSKKFQERFLRLTSDGVLAWYQSDMDSAEKMGAIQVRGETFKQDTSDLHVLSVQLLLKGKDYKFKFSDPREAALWLAAFLWHGHRKPLRSPHVSVSNKAK